MINGLPTVYEVVTGIAKKQPKPSNGGSKSSKSNSKPSRQSNSNSKPAKPTLPKDEEDNGQEDAQDEEQAYLCGSCGETYANGEFWICCDICEKWFHGKCVRITPAKAEHIKHYKCPACSSKRSRE